MFEKATRGMGKYGKIAYIFLVAMGVAIPLAAGSEYYPVPITVSQFGLYKMCAFFVLLGGAALFFALDFIFGQREVRWHSIMWWALGYGAITIFSYVFAIDKRVSLFGEYDRFLGLVPTLLTVFLLFLSLQLIRNNAAMRFFMHAFVMTSLVLAIYGIAQAFGIEIAQFADTSSLGHRSFSLFGNPNLYAGYLSFAVFFSAGLLATEKEKPWKVFYWVVLLANLAVTLTSMTRSIWLACIIAGPLFILFLVRQKVEFTTSDKIVTGTAAASGLAFALFTLTRKTAELNIGTRLASMFRSDGSSSTRIEIWKTALQVIKEYPLFGSGPDSFGVSATPKLTLKYLSIMGMNSTSNNAHCMPLQLASTIGIAGMLSYYVVLGYGCLIAFKYAWDNSEKSQSYARLFYASVLCAVLAYSINALVSVAPLDAMPFYWLCLGFLVAPKARSIEVNFPVCAAASSVVAVIIFVGSLVFSVCFIGADHSYRLAKEMQQGSSGQVEAYAKAKRLNPFEATYETGYADSLGGNYISRISSLTAHDASIFLATLNQSYEKYPERNNMQTVASYYYSAMAMLFPTQDLINAAISVNDSILAKARYDIATMANLAAVYRVSGDESKAQALRAKIVGLGPDSKKKQEALSFVDSTQPSQ